MSRMGLLLVIVTLAPAWARADSERRAPSAGLGLTLGYGSTRIRADGGGALGAAYYL